MNGLSIAYRLSMGIAAGTAFWVFGATSARILGNTGTEYSAFAALIIAIGVTAILE